MRYLPRVLASLSADPSDATMADREQYKECAIFVLDRGFKWIGPFFAALAPLAAWAFFIDSPDPENTMGGLLGVGILGFFAVFSHLTWVRTRVVVDAAGIAVRGLLGERRVGWEQVSHARIEGPDLVFHLVTGQALKASCYLAGFSTLVEIAAMRGILRSEDAV